MATLENYRNPSFVKFCVAQLEQFCADVGGVKSAILATADGFEVATFNNSDGKQSGDKLAAVGSSLFSLGSSLVHEFNLEDCKSISIDSERGRVYISAIREGNKQLILMVQATQQAMLARILHGAGKLSEQITQKMALM